MRMFTLLLAGFSCVIILIVTVCLYRTFTLSVQSVKQEQNNETDAFLVQLKSDLDRRKEEIVNRFATALRFRTVSTKPHDYDSDELLNFQTFIFNSFPVLKRDYVATEVVNNYSLLIKVNGSNALLKPYLLCAHLDVVPVVVNAWTVPPFSGLIKDGFVYGRGAIDIKCLVMSILEALQTLFDNGFKPERSFYIAFGHDEEVQGEDGAGHIATRLEEIGVTSLEFLLDEGLTIITNGFPGITKPMAMVGVTEKGFVNVKLSIDVKDAGHSSMPPEDTAITLLARQVERFNSKTQPAILGQVEKDMLNTIAPHAPFILRLAFANTWLFSPLITWMMSRKPSTNALIRTSTAVTLMNGGVKDNVLPTQASAIINHRTHPEQEIEDVIAIDESVLTDENVKVTHNFSQKAHNISDYGPNSFGYSVIKRSLTKLFPDAIVTPGTLVGATDTKWYKKFTKNIYRHIPVVMTLEDTKMIHGHNERLSVENYMKIVEFYHNIILNADK